MKIFKRIISIVLAIAMFGTFPVIPAEAAGGSCKIVMVTPNGNYVKELTAEEGQEVAAGNPLPLAEWVAFLEASINGSLGRPALRPDGTITKSTIQFLNKGLLWNDLQVSVASGQKKIIYAITPYLTYTENPADLLDYSAINFMISSFSTKYKAGIDREINVALAASRINGTVVWPGETFSASNAMGVRSSQNGYVTAAVYSDGEVVDGMGGGICQVSSTIFNTIMLAGIVPTKRYSHSMHVTYLAPGLDATIVSGSKDLQFVNPYSYPIYIEALARQGVLTINFYSNANALGGYHYMPHTEGSAMSNKTYLLRYLNGTQVDKIYVGSSRYQEAS